MRLICIWQRRQLARQAVLGRPIAPHTYLAKHIKACESCARAARDFAYLNELLPAASTRPQPSSDFSRHLRERLRQEQDLRQRSDARQRHAPGLPTRRTYALSAVAVCTAAGMIVLFAPALLRTWLRGTVPPAVSVERSNRGNGLHAWYKQPGKPADRPSKDSPKVAVKSSAPSKPIADDPRRKAALRSPEATHRTLRSAWTHYRRLRSHNSAVRRYARAGVIDRNLPRPAGKGNASLAAPVAVLEVSVVAPTYPDMGDLYAAFGDHGSASRAYGSAFTQQRDAELAIAASNQAEQAGNASQALEYCAAALR